MIYTCNLGSLGPVPYGTKASLLREASLTSPETQGRKPFGLTQKDTILVNGCQEGTYQCLGLHNFTEDYEEKYELLNNPLRLH